MGAPGVAEGPVEGHVVGLVCVEHERAVGGVLADRGDAAVADQRVAVRERLHVALAGGEQRRVGMRVGLDQSRLMGLQVELDAQAARLGVDRRVRAVVEERQLAVGQHAAVVLPGHLRPGAHLERALVAAEAPQDLAAAGLQQVAGPRAARRDQQVAARLGIDRVEVEVVPRRGPARRFDFGLGCRDVVEAVPFPAHEARVHVDLLDRRVDDRAACRAVHRAQVAADRVVGRDVGDVVRGELELVQVGLQPVAAGDPRDGLDSGSSSRRLRPGRSRARARAPATT